MVKGRTHRFGRPYFWLIKLIGLIVPRSLRDEWNLEWESELVARESLLLEWRKFNLIAKLDLLHRSLGSLRDALLLQPKRLEEEMFQDLRYGFRMLRKNPGFTLVAVIALALGIGATTAIFSVVYGVLLRPLPYKDAERIVIAGISPLDFRDVQASAQSFDRMAIWASNLYNVTINGESFQVLGATVTPNFFEVLSPPMLGRQWTPEEDTHPVMIISHEFWQTRFGGNPAVIGQTLRLNRELFTIVGVMPPEFEYPRREFKLWTTYGYAMAAAPQQAQNRQFRIFRAVAHLKPGVTLSQMRAEINTISQRLQGEYPDSNSGVNIQFTPMYEQLVGSVRSSLWVLLGTVGFVLFISCV